MPAQFTTEDLLPHIANQQPVGHALTATTDAANLPLHDQVSAIRGQIVLIAAFGCSVVLSYDVQATMIQVDLTLQTPLGNVSLGHAQLDPQHPSITLGGSVAGFKAEVTLSFDFSTLELTGTATVCAPFVGCKKGSFSFRL